MTIPLSAEDKASAELKRAETRVSAILSIAADAIISLDNEFRITLFNEGAVSMFGYSRQEVIGEKLDLLIPERFRTRHHHHVADFASKTINAKKMGDRQDIFGRRKDGSEFPAEASIAKQDLSGDRFYMVVVRDVTERNEIQAALARANSDLERRVAERTRELQTEIEHREAAQNALIQAQRMEAFGQLTGGIAHDFNNLLTIVTGNLELLIEGADPERAPAYLKRAADAADMGASLTKRLLLFARRQRLTPQTLDMNTLIRSVSEILIRATGETIAVETNLAGGLWPTLADASEVENALLNLALNARDAMPAGGTLRISTRNETRAGPTGPAEFVVAEVADTGSGMSQDVLVRAMEPFFTTKGPGRGTGLGLSTVYGFAHQSGGSVAIDSQIGEGTTVTIRLPRAVEADADKAAAIKETIPLSENSETILVVEDNPEVRELTLQRVEGLGYVALEAASGQAAMELFRSGAKIDVLLTDVVMAGISGFELAGWTRANYPQTPVVIATGYADEELQQDPDALKSIQTLRKPYKRIDLAIALRNALTPVTAAAPRR